ncbi:YndJ family protein [Litchfieldia alkalitelluris]|uniref:YndJ family protein n=1 Tax=Litchfieldia alkalitelluris TaxID=304268 RepID=UPI001472CC11|nr:YndJ family protein [Litchfieldia alkalitelluris]
MTFRKLALLNFILFLLLFFLNVRPWYFLMLTIAQLVYIPLTLHLILKEEKKVWIKTYFPLISIPAFLSVFVLQISGQTAWDGILVTVYFLFTIMVALYGMNRFVQRGFISLEEFMIDIGLLYLAIGGAWSFAFEMNINTGFSPIITWLTSIHFHYSAFLLPIFVGWLGRIIKPTLYIWGGWSVILSPFIVAAGISFSPILEVISVLIYIFAIYGLIFLAFKAPIKSRIQKLFIRFSFSTLGITIVFSLLYAFSNFSNQFIITIDFMLRFHGIVNAILFALIGIIGWSLHTPPILKAPLTFPVSMIRGRSIIGEGVLAGKLGSKKYKGLVDQLKSYEPDIDVKKLSPSIVDFYENTKDYRLFTQVKWLPWFMPFAGGYRLISKITKQINLPLTSREVEMTGDILSIDDKIDGRNETRAWIRKIGEEVSFVALYSSHKEDGYTYMNIALPLPWSSMIGILKLEQVGKDLCLTSKVPNTGIFLAVKNNILRLPLSEEFYVHEEEEGVLKATHKMWIFSVPFLTIDYNICKKDKCHGEITNFG